MRYLLLVVCLLCSQLWSAAQNAGGAALGPVRIGEKIPDAIWNTIPKSDSTRLIILDQWATSCTGCIKAFPKMEALQQAIGSQLQVVLVTRNSQQQIDAKPAVKKRLPRLPSLVGDTLLSALFPYVMVPQHVWVDQAGVVKAITDGGNATEENVREFLQESDISLRQKKDLIGFDYHKPLFSGPDFPVDQMQFYSVFIKGKVGLKSGNTFRKRGDTVHGRSLTNTDLLSLYKIAARELIPGFNEKRMVVDVTAPAVMAFDYNDPNEDRGKLYSYDLIVPVTHADRLYEYMLADLNRMTNYIGRIEQRRLPCLALVRTSKKDRIAANGKEKQENSLFRGSRPVIRNYPLAYMVSRVGDLPFVHLPVIDETGYKNMVTLEFNGPVNDLATLNRELKRYDLRLVKVTRKLDVFVLRDKE